jgi:predicted PurR-regulated permease PerM
MSQRPDGTGSTPVPVSDGPRQIVVAPQTIAALVVAAVGALLALQFVFAARAILVQLVVAVVLAMALEPFVRTLERRGASRGQAVGVAFTIALAAVAGFAYVLITPLVSEVTSFAHHAPGLLQKLTHGRGRLGFLETRFHVVDRVRTWVTHQGGGALLAGPAAHTVSRLASSAAAAVTVAFLTLFVALGGRAWFDAIVDVMPEGSRARWRRGGSGISSAVGGYVTGNLLISLIAGTVTTVILLATGVPYAAPLGLVVAVFDLIPLVGATIGTIIVAAVALTKGIPTTVVVVVGMWVYQKIENHTLLPLVYHRTVKLSPLAIAVSVAAGAEVGGIVGALLGIPAAAALKVAAREALAWHRGQEAPPEPEHRSRRGRSRPARAVSARAARERE